MTFLALQMQQHVKTLAGMQTTTWPISIIGRNRWQRRIERNKTGEKKYIGTRHGHNSGLWRPNRTNLLQQVICITQDWRQLLEEQGTDTLRHPNLSLPTLCPLLYHTHWTSQSALSFYSERVKGAPKFGFYDMTRTQHLFWKVLKHILCIIFTIIYNSIKNKTLPPLQCFWFVWWQNDFLSLNMHTCVIRFYLNFNDWNKNVHACSFIYKFVLFSVKSTSWLDQIHSVLDCEHRFTRTSVSRVVLPWWSAILPTHEDVFCSTH